MIENKSQVQNQNRLLVLSLLLFAVVSYFYMLHKVPSLDLMAMWLAGLFYHSGEMAQIYPPDMGAFTMYPPNGWIEYMRAEYGFTGPIYPYIYPPIWAWLAGLIAAQVPFVLISKLALLLNVAALAGAIGLTYKLAQPRLNPALFVGLSAVVLLLTPIGFVALAQSQVQILVSLLILLALERSRFDHPLAAGMALALAASLKLYPALFAIFWLATGERRAFVSFALSGAFLAALSVTLTGWPLHADFLRQISIISDTVFVTAVTVNFDAVIALVFHGDAMQLVPVLDDSRLEIPLDGWRIMLRPVLWKILSNLMLLAVIAALWRGFRTTSKDRQYALWWPLALTLIPLCSPMTWLYYYIPTALFAATIPGRWGLAKGLPLLLLGLIPMLKVLIPLYNTFTFVIWLMPITATLGLLIWCLALVFAPHKKV